MNKHLINLCYVPGAPVSKDPNGKIVRRETGSLSYEIDGIFHRSQDILNTNLASPVALSGAHPIDNGNMHIYVGKTAFESLIEATFKEKGFVEISSNEIQMKVEDLDEIIEGFSTAFNEDDDVYINARVEQISAI